MIIWLQKIYFLVSNLSFKTMNTKKNYSYPTINLSRYLEDFLNSRKIFLEKSDYPMNQNINHIKSEICNLINDAAKYEKKQFSLNGELDRIIIESKLSDKIDKKLISYLKRYFEIHRVIYSKLNSHDKKMDTNSFPNDINILFKISYLLQMLHLKTKDFSPLSTSIKINDFILDNFSSEDIHKSLYLKYLFHHEILILRKYNEHI